MSLRIFKNKPLHLYPHNRPKLPPLKPIRPVNVPETLEVKTTKAVTMRKEAIHRMLEMRKEHPELLNNPPHPPLDNTNYNVLTKESAKKLYALPDIIPKSNKSSDFRYKTVRGGAVVPCDFQAHLMAFGKPPFTFHKLKTACGTFKPDPELEKAYSATAARSRIEREGESGKKWEKDTTGFDFAY